MSDLRPTVERELERVKLRPFTLDAFNRRRELRRRNQRIVAGAVGVAVALIAVLVGTSIVRSSPVPANPHPSPPISRGAQLTYETDAGIVAIDTQTGRRSVIVPDIQTAKIAWSPDGTQLVYEAHRSATQPCAVLVRTIATGRERVLANCGSADPNKSLDWSADGNWIAFQGSSNGGPGEQGQPITLIHPDGTGEKVLTDPGGFPISGGPFSLSPDGNQIVFQSGFQISKMNVNGSGRRPLTRGMSPEWFADGRIAFIRDDNPPGGDTNGDPFVAQLWTIHSDGGAATKLYSWQHCCIGGVLTGPAWSTDGSELALFVLGRLRIVEADGSGRRTLPFRTSLFFHGLVWRPMP